MKLGIRLGRGLDIEYEHHSQHLLDSTYPYQRFPVEDSIGVKLHLFRNSSHDTIF